MNAKGTNGTSEASGESAEEGSAQVDSPELQIAELRQKLETQAARLDEVLRAYSSLQQEREVFRKRSEREKERVLEVERGNVALALLEAVDELDRSLLAVDENTDEALAEGVRLIRDGLLRRVLSSGIQRFETVGQLFDPTLHEATDTVPVSDPNLDERVVEEVRAGYRQGDRVLRAARVRVGRLTHGNGGE